MNYMPLCGIDLKEKLKALIRIPSLTPPIDVADMAKTLQQFGSELGADVELQEVMPGKPNCILTFTWGSGKTLVFNTHMDVNNPSGQVWHRSPLVPEEDDGRIYGLGACDAKGSMAAMLEAIERVVRKPGNISGQLKLTAVMGEEAGGLGSLYMCNRGLKADGAVVGEPTELALCTVHKGTYMRKITFTGLAVHSARSRTGRNAIDHAVLFCGKYQHLQKKLEAFPHPILGPADASVTIIRGGTRQNTIPESCEIIIDRRLLPGETKDKADEEVALILQDLQKEVPEFKANIETIVSTVPSETPASAEIVQCAMNSLENTLGRPIKPTGFCGGCDMSKLVTISGIPTVIVGPGSMENAHSPDEFVEFSQVTQAADVYEGIIRKFLNPC